MTKQFTLLQLFLIVDGRLSTFMEDVYMILNHICNDDLMMHHIPVAVDYLKEKNPDWYKQVKDSLMELTSIIGNNNFEEMIATIKGGSNVIYDIPQLKDEFDTSDFIPFMLNNSLLLKKYDS